MTAISYTHLIAIQTPTSATHLKEWLDIALVSASYDINTAIYLDTAVIVNYQTLPPMIEQAFNMLADFEIPLFSNQSQQWYGQTLTAKPLVTLQQQSRHCFIF